MAQFLFILQNFPGVYAFITVVPLRAYPNIQKGFSTAVPVSWIHIVYNKGREGKDIINWSTTFPKLVQSFAIHN